MLQFYSIQVSISEWILCQPTIKSVLCINAIYLKLHLKKTLTNHEQAFSENETDFDTLK